MVCCCEEDCTKGGQNVVTFDGDDSGLRVRVLGNGGGVCGEYVRERAPFLHLTRPFSLFSGRLWGKFSIGVGYRQDSGIMCSILTFQGMDVAEVMDLAEGQKRKVELHPLRGKKALDGKTDSIERH